jgi:hypothetical protein
MNEVEASTAAAKAKSYLAALASEKAGYEATGKAERAKACAAEIERVKKSGQVTPVAKTADDDK